MPAPFSNARDFAIAWGDCDPAGIVFYPRYFAWFDAATWDLLEAALTAGGQALLDRFGIIGFPLVDARAEFHAPLRFGDRLHIVSQVDAVGRSSLAVTHRLSRSDGTLAVTGRETRVWAAAHPDDTHRITGVPVPDLVRNALLNATGDTE